MKVLKFTLPLFAMALLIISGCGGPKEVTKARNSEEISIPCETKEEYWSDDKYFRASHNAESADMSTAKKIAMQQARAALATKVENTVKRTTDNYVQQQDVNDKQEVKRKFEDISRTVVRQELHDLRTNCTQATKNKDSGDYTYYVNLEMSKKALVEGINDQISKQEELELEYDKQKFEDTMEKEMKKLDENRP